MKFSFFLFLLLTFPCLFSCCTNSSTQESSDSIQQDSTIIVEDTQSFVLNGNTVKTRFGIPEKFERVKATPGSFEEFLQNLPLIPIPQPVDTYKNHITRDSLY